MADNATLPAAQPDMAGPSPFDQLSGLARNPALRRSLPALGAAGAIGLAAIAYLTIASGPQRVLYSNLSDTERAGVAEALTQGGIDYSIDPATGMVSVAEQDLYQARMLVASNTGLATPQSATDMLDSIPLGSSRTLEGERLRLARERELTLTIQEIDGISSVRVHLATPERSVFVRENSPPSASVMVRLARGRSLGKEQVDAIVNLVAGSVPGLSSDAVRVADQNGRLLSAESEGTLDGLLLQREFEAKLRDQLAQLLVPLLGEGNFSTQVQVELDHAEVTAARESYDREGAIRRESETVATRSTGGTSAGGVPGVLANTPPPPSQLVEQPPQGSKPASTTSTNQDSESSTRRDYELGREVSVTSSRPGGLSRLSVAVAVSAEALKKIAPANEAKIKSLVEAAVGADGNRGDVVTVVSGKFDVPVVEETPFYDTELFAMALRYGTGLLAALLVLIFGVRPFLKRMQRDKDDGESEYDDDDIKDALAAPAGSADAPFHISAHGSHAAQPSDLPQQIELARKLTETRPDRALAALERLLAAPDGTGGAA